MKFESFVQNVRYTIRNLVKRPGFTAVVVLTAGLAIGASTTTFSAVNGVLLRPLPYSDPSRLVYVATGGGPGVSSIPDFIDWKGAVATMDRLAALQPSSIVTLEGRQAERVSSARVSPDVFDVMGVTPVMGRPFSPEEYRTGAAPAVIVSHEYWVRSIGADPDVIGKSLTTAGASAGEPANKQIVGVLPKEFTMPDGFGLGEPQVWVPLPVDETARAGNRESRTLRVVGRLLADDGLDAARQEMSALAARIGNETGHDLQVTIVPLMEKITGRVDLALWILFGSTGLLLLIGTANVGNLLLARATSRTGEFALRSALGASGGRIVAQILTESILLGILAGVVGIGSAAVGVKLLHLMGPADLPRLSNIALDLRVVAFGLGVSCLVGAICGLIPAVAVHHARGAALRATGGRAGTSRVRERLRQVLIVSQTALALLLLCASGLLIKSFTRLQRLDLGFDPEGVLVMEVRLDRSYTAPMRAAFVRDLQAGLRAIPGVQSASAVLDPPLSGFGSYFWGAYVWPEGTSQEDGHNVWSQLIGPDYFHTMGIPLIRGREIEATDDVNGSPVAVVSETTANRIWPNEDPVGKHLFVGNGPSNGVTVVGLVADTRHLNLPSTPTGEIYYAHAAMPSFRWMFLTARISDGGNPTMIVPLMREALQTLAPGVPFEGVTIMEERVAAALSNARFNAFLLAAFAAAALVLTVAGIYATVHYVVSRRTRELGIRIALGAQRKQVVGHVLRQVLRPTGIGFFVGLAGTVGFTRVLENLLFGVDSIELPTFAVATSILAVAAVLACIVPARRASRSDPLVALRSE